MGSLHTSPHGISIEHQSNNHEYDGEFLAYGIAGDGCFWGEGRWAVVGRSGVDGGGMCYCGDEGGGDGGELGVWMMDGFIFSL